VSREYRLYLVDVQSACEKILRYTNGLELDGFLKDERTFDAVIRNLEILGEAVKHIPSEIQVRYPQLSGAGSQECAM
jgi:uncharacterized protein with HEPN domain